MTFDALYMARRNHIAWRADVIGKAIKRVLNPASAIDLGCATGDVVLGLLREGVQAFGVDNSPAAGNLLPPDRFVLLDLTRAVPPAALILSKELFLAANADLVILLEVLPILADGHRIAALRHAAKFSSKWLLTNRTTDAEEVWLQEHGFELRLDKTAQLRAELYDLKDKQAIKALYLTGEIWKRVKVTKTKTPVKEASVCAT